MTAKSRSSASGSIVIRKGASLDAAAIVGITEVAQPEEQRRAFADRVIETGQCYVAETPRGTIAGYVVLDYTFYHQGFVSMLYVGKDHRRSGVGTKLMRHLEGLCMTPKIFTSTNLSNLPMQGLLSQLGYVLSGVIEHLDEGDPELIFVKFLDPNHDAA
jgi:ribosomal protein S18 acetylase RimI-like enzyme